MVQAIFAQSPHPKGHDDDGLPAYRDPIGRIGTPKRPVKILPQRVPYGDGVRIWKFSSVTVAQTPRLYDRFGYRFVGDVLSVWLLDPDPKLFRS